MIFILMLPIVLWFMAFGAAIIGWTELAIRSFFNWLEIAWPHRDITNEEGLYLRRYYLSPRRWKYRLFLHHIYRSDSDRAPHDHPWKFWSMMLKGSYVEFQTVYAGPVSHYTRIHQSKRFRIRFRPATWIHRLVLDAPCWTLVLAGQTERLWGFWTSDGWVYWRDYLGVGGNGETHE